jgi:uncharacterized Zn finger protein
MSKYHETKTCKCGQKMEVVAVDLTKGNPKDITWQCMKCGHVERTGK